MSQSTSSLKQKKILIVHFRVGKTDGVSLQIELYRQLLKSRGADVYLCAGPISEGADYVIEELEQQLDPQAFIIDEDAFGGLKNFVSVSEFKRSFQKRQQQLMISFREVIEQLQPTNLIVSNIFSVGEGLYAAGALSQVLDRYQIPTIAINHDWYWEHDRYREPTCELVEKQLDQYFPPRRDYLRLACINSIAQKEVARRKNVTPQLVHDIHDFQQAHWKRKPNHNKIMAQHGVDQKRVVILQATRIVRRKNIEIAINLTRKINRKLKELSSPVTLYDGRKVEVHQEHPAVLVLAGYAEKRHRWYLEQLLEYAAEQEVKIAFVGERVGTDLELSDVYPYADLITFPSFKEGFGNQFLEAVFAKKPVALFEYPVFKSDIKPRGFHYINLGDYIAGKTSDGLVQLPPAILEEASDEAINLLQNNPAYRKFTETNFQLGLDNYHLDNLIPFFQDNLV